MENRIEYKGYVGEASVDIEVGLIHGRVINIERDTLTFRGETPAEARQDFHKLIDEYLSDCANSEHLFENAEVQKTFEFRFNDYSSPNGISFDFNDEMDEEMVVVVEHGVSVIYANKQAYLALAKAFIKMALGRYLNGFHFHLNQNFDGDEPEALRCHLVSSSEA